MAPLVTVITATYNSAALLRLSLASLIAQEYTNFEAWIVGDACTDDSEAVVAAFADRRLHWVNLTTNSGSQAAPNNAGLDRATGDLVAYLGHDDLWFPWHLGGLVACLERTNANFVYGLSALLDRRGPFVAIGPPPAGVTYRDHLVPPSTWLHTWTPSARLPRGDGAPTEGRVAADEWWRWRDPSSLGWAVDNDILRRAALAGARFAFEPRLSLLKFPSPLFRSYAPSDRPPEAPFLADMQRDPLELERRVLTDLAMVSALQPLQHLGRLESHRQLLRRTLFVSFRRLAVDPFRGWPVVAQLLRRRYQRFRKGRRRARGLD